MPFHALVGRHGGRLLALGISHSGRPHGLVGIDKSVPLRTLCGRDLKHFLLLGNSLLYACLALFGCHGLHARATLHDFIAWLHCTSYASLARWHAPGGATAGLRKGGGSGQTHGQNGRLYWETHYLLLLKER